MFRISVSQSLKGFTDIVDAWPHVLQWLDERLGGFTLVEKEENFNKTNNQSSSLGIS